MKYEALPYMHDVLPNEPDKEPWRHAARWRAVESAFRNTCRLFGFREIRTPVLEKLELFERSVGLGTDIIHKEMFSFEDRGGRVIALRPEGTASVMRAFVENGLASEPAPHKLYYISSIFRNEAGQEGRYREHQQTGAELIGAAGPIADAEIISLALEFYRSIKLVNLELRINSVGCPACRPAYREALLDFARPLLSRMSEDNQTRFELNPLRMLDSKDETDKVLMANAPKLGDFLCPECSDHFAGVLKCLDALSVVYTLDDNLVRGFDYYTKTAFEIISPQLGAQNVVGGGGRYDGLMEEIGGLPTPGVGFGIGTERCLIALEKLGVKLDLEDERPQVLVAPLGDTARVRAVQITSELRRAGISTEMDLLGRGLKAQMRHADKAGARFVVLLGDNELERGEAAVKSLFDGGGQVAVALEGLSEWITAHLAA